MPFARHWTQAAGIKRDGQYRCKMEREVVEAAKQLDRNLQYEKLKIPYTREQTYVADVYLSNGILVEIKGYFEAKDRTKMLLVKEQHPEFDIRFVFANPNSKLGGGSTTTYAEWATKHGFKWAAKCIPTEWIKEDGYKVLEADKAGD
jgi:hypothetical protein